MIILKNIFLGYNKEYYALYDINLTIKDGERVAIVGEDGCGKTALLRIIAGLDKPQKGEIYIDNTPIQKVDFKSGVSLGYLSSKAVFFESKSVYKNLMWALKIRGIDKSLCDKKVCETLNGFGIENLKNEKVGKLCRSDRKLVQIARLALRNIDILLCDDIDFNEDVKMNERLNYALRKLVEADNKNKIVIMSCKNFDACKDLVGRKIALVSGSIDNEWE